MAARKDYTFMRICSMRRLYNSAVDSDVVYNTIGILPRGNFGVYFILKNVNLQTFRGNNIIITMINIKITSLFIMI